MTECLPKHSELPTDAGARDGQNADLHLGFRTTRLVTTVATDNGLEVMLQWSMAATAATLPT